MSRFFYIFTLVSLVFFQKLYSAGHSGSSGVREAIYIADSLIDENQHKMVLPLIDSLYALTLRDELELETDLLNWVYADFYFSLDKYEESLHYFRKLLGKNWDTADSEFLGKMARALNDMGIVFYRVGKIDSAIVVHQKSIEWAEKVDNGQVLAYNYNNLSVLMKERKLMDEAIENLQKSAFYIQEIGDTLGLGFNYLGLALLYQDEGNYSLSVDHYLKSLAIFEKYGNELEVMLVYDRLGRYYLQLHDGEQAKEYFDKEYNLALKTGTKRFVAHTASNYATYFRNKGMQDSAFYYYDKAITTFNLTQYKKPLIKAMKGKGELLYKSGRLSEAILLLNETLEIAQNKFSGEAIAVYGKLANIYLDLGAYDKAKELAEKALENVDVEDQNLLARIDLFDVLYKVEKEKGNYEKAFGHLEKLHVNTDSSFNQEKRLEMARVEYDYHSKKEREIFELEKEKQAMEFQQEIEKAELIRNTIIIITFLSIALFIVSFRSYKRKIKANRVLAKQADDLALKNQELAEMYKKEQALMKTNLEEKDRRIAAFTMNQHEKDGILKKIDEKIQVLSQKNKEIESAELKRIQKLVKSNIDTNGSWDSFVHQFEQVHPDFFTSIRSQYFNLTVNDLKICAYIKIGMDNKSIAQVTNLTLNTVKSRIHRLKKKMDLSPEENIRNLVISIN
ncbi:tetratricopeptide repeat protein [Xanthovirga aplysinae]|uniref:tetratricopeptide repeat protein n=1 Tax=Xanthovirga aplysinae TaxID=2529853 RepID=UPI0012BBA736|nr:tetratricopeptide repeat protein [Xanthovirga aplysinae]MTI32030.1 tetratricopeptide repeat protein [Xanthovirga aplysinae]